MTIAAFIIQCDDYCRDRGVSRVWLSKRLFSDTFKLDQLADGSADVGVRRLEKAAADLAVLISDLHVGGSGSDTANLNGTASEGAENRGENVSRTEEVAA
ncbi:MAG TPA: hypothetical protein VN018_02155 [Brevundimonas sp.]|nr:hypothetical protein [Brevundimonas sp.]